MRCQFLKHGLAIDYNRLVRPCCSFHGNQTWRDQNQIQKVNLVTWHQKSQLVELRDQLSNDQWPSECHVCKELESQGRGDSMRLNAQSSYAHYQPEDITLEIRPGNVCNFACQTCWPEASSRVTDFYQRAGIDTTQDWTASDEHSITIAQERHPLDLDKIGTVLPRIKDIVILGGEPFYDPNCKKLLTWLVEQQCTANLLIFTNGSCIDREMLQNYPGKITLIFSIDAMGEAAEYIRFGTRWSEVCDNYLYSKSQPDINTRVNITVSAYNFHLVGKLVEWLAQDWPEVVSFGVASTVNNSWFMDESVLPLLSRAWIVEHLQNTLGYLDHADIEQYQRINAQNALSAIVDRLQDMPFDAIKYQRFVDFVAAMDRVKRTNFKQSMPVLAGILGY